MSCEEHRRKVQTEIVSGFRFCWDLEDSKSTSVGLLCIFGSRTFVPFNWVCMKQTAVSHSSTESEVISSDAGCRMDGIPALDLWDLVIEVLHSSPNKSLSQGKRGAVRRQCETLPEGRTKTKPLTSEGCCLREIDDVTPNAKLSRHNAVLLCILKTKRQ